MEQSYKEKLTNRIWKTKKARMESETRFNKLDKRNSLLNIYYSVFLLILSLLDYTKKINFNENFSLYILIFSILLIAFSIYTGNNRFLQRATEMRLCYTTLSKLEGELYILDVSQEKEIQEINIKYQDVLNQFENHETIDYLSTEKSKTVKFPFIKNFKIIKCQYGYLWFKYKLSDLTYWLLPFIILYFLKNYG